MTTLKTPEVDVSISAYGKPYMTAVSIFSLLKYSGKHINKVYLIPEKHQPHNANFNFLKRRLGDKLELYQPSFFFGLRPAKKSLLWFNLYRRSLRYQYSFEKSKKKYLFVAHNDMLFHQDILGYYLEQMNKGTYVGVGPIGQCWNCPAFSANYCDGGTNYDAYRPTWDEFLNLCEQYPAPRKEVYTRFMGDKKAWPLPECRLNEWAALINLDTIRPWVKKPYRLTPLGQMDLDTGTMWFRNLNHLGLKFKHASLDSYGTHVWTGVEGEPNSGLDTQNRFELYQRAERMAYQKLISEFGFSAEELVENSNIIL
ncbi:MAG: hypothetical protein ACOVOW_03530 [Spirosomataceae bacterium]